MPRRLPPLLFAVLAALIWAADGPARAQQVQYQAELTGVEEGALRERIAQVSRLIALADQPPASPVALEQRAAADRERILDLLRAEGYYAGTVDIALDLAATPPLARIGVVPGPPFLLTDFSVRSRNPDPAAAPVEVALSALGIALGQRAVATEIVEAQRRLIGELARRAYPLAEVVDRRVVVDHAANSLSVDLLIDTGPFARFGRVDFSGLEQVERSFLERRVPWNPGDPFSLDRVAELRRKLSETGLFTTIRVTPGEAVDEEGRLPLAVEVAERPHRSFGGGIDYSTAEGPGANVFWEHRNLFGEGERLRASAFYSDVRFGIGTTYRIPDFGTSDQDFFSEASIERQDTDSFRTDTAQARGGMEWRLSEIWWASAGLALERMAERERIFERLGRRRVFTLVSVPLEARRDTTDSLLDPTRGGRFNILLEPYPGALGSQVAFTRLRLSDTIHHQVADDPRVILAGWGQAGTIFADSTAELPADKRFYAGGGGSVRAFGHQLAGPVDALGRPLGGRSLLAFGGEVRVRVTEAIGIVPFLEGGTVYNEQFPNLNERLNWGAGLGVRYFTGIGPVRADLAVPLNRRSGVDDAFQIYLSLGQAF